MSVVMDYLNQFLNPPVRNEEEFEKYTNLLQSIVETKLKEEVKLPGNTRDIMNWVSKNYLEIEEQVENPQVGTIALAQEEEEDDFEADFETEFADEFEDDFYGEEEMTDEAE